MAQKRMFNLQIVDSDAFLDMPMSSQLLYFHLAMRADDDGFIGNPRRIARMIGGNEDDLKLLIAKRFLLSFESGVVIIKHWLINNSIRTDIYHETQYKKEKSQLGLNENKAYTELREGVSEIKQIEAPEWLKKRRKQERTVNGTQTVSENRLDKIRIDKNNIFFFWNEQKIIIHKKLTSKMETKINSALKDFSLEDIKSAIKKYGEVINNKKYYWTYKWTLEEFLQRGLVKFMDTPIEEFKNFEKPKEKKPFYNGQEMRKKGNKCENGSASHAKRENE